MSEYKLHVSRGNMKLGLTLSVSLPPIVTCVPKPPCAGLCYARKAYDGYARTSCKPAWDENLAFYKADPHGYFDAIIQTLAHMKRTEDRRYFRWHVGGDIPDEAYLDGMYKVAYLMPGWNFLAYSRRPYAWTHAQGSEEIAGPRNLRVLRSLWIDSDGIDHQHPWFKVLLPNEPVPKGMDLCSGSCATCKRCWHLEPGQGMAIYLH